MLAISSHASALAMVASKSLARRRLRPNQAPAFSFGLKSTDSLGSGDDLDGPFANLGDRIQQLVTAIDAIREDVPELGKSDAEGFQQRHCTMIVLNVGGMNLNREQRTARICNDVSLAPFQSLGHVKSTRTATFRCLDALTVEQACVPLHDERA